MATLKYIAGADLMTVTLDSAYTAASGTMALTAGHGARLPTAGDFWLRTTTGTYRCFKVTARTDDALTVTAAQDGTSDGNLDAGTELKWVLGATALDQLRADSYREMTVSQFAGLTSLDYKDGDRIALTDSIYEVRRASGAWKYWYKGFLCTPPPSTGWTAINSAVYDFDRLYLHMVRAANTGDNFQAAVRTLPSAPYTITLGMRIFLMGASYPNGGAAWRESGGARDGYVTNWSLLIYNSIQRFQTVKRTGPTNYTGSYAPAWNGDASVTAIPDVAWFRLRDTGSIRYGDYSIDKQNWMQLLTINPNTDFLTPNQYGVLADTNNASAGPSILDLISLEEA